MRSNRQGFSLVELMIVVAIIGILAAIAIPNFITMQLKAKRAEVPGNVDGIKTAEVSFDAAYDRFVDCAVGPDSTPGKQARSWSTGVAGWTTLGWSPDGEVRGSYSVATAATATNFTVIGTADVDGDANPVHYSATTSTNALIWTGEENYY